MAKKPTGGGRVTPRGRSPPGPARRRKSSGDHDHRSVRRIEPTAGRQSFGSVGPTRPATTAASGSGHRTPRRPRSGWVEGAVRPQGGGMVSVVDVRPTMVPPAEPPTGRAADGPPDRHGDARPRTRGPSSARSTTSATWARSSSPGCRALGTIGLAVWIDQWWPTRSPVLAMGPAFARFAILGHEAAHKLLFTNKRINDWVGRWLVAYPVRPARRLPAQPLRPPQGRVRAQRAGPEPLQRLPRHRGEPAAQAVARRPGHVRVEEPEGLLYAFKSETARPFAIRIAVMQLLLIVAAIAVGVVAVPAALAGPLDDGLAGHQPAALDREHGGMQRSNDRRETTHHVRQSWIARATIVPLNTGWHLAHHVDMGVPWRNLPKLHAELEAAGLRHPGAHLPELSGPLEEPRVPPRGADRLTYGSTTTGSPVRIVPGSRTQA